MTMALTRWEDQAKSRSRIARRDRASDSCCIPTDVKPLWRESLIHAKSPANQHADHGPSNAAWKITLAMYSSAVNRGASSLLLPPAINTRPPGSTVAVASLARVEHTGGRAEHAGGGIVEFRAGDGVIGVAGISAGGDQDLAVTEQAGSRCITRRAQVSSCRETAAALIEHFGADENIAGVVLSAGDQDLAVCQQCGRRTVAPVQIRRHRARSNGECAGAGVVDFRAAVVDG